jgi:molybdenum cofactor guanylyltransferase
MADTVPDAVKLAGVVLAGGESRRMGRDKANLPFPSPFSTPAAYTGDPRNTTLVEHVVGIVAQRCEPIFVVAAPGQPLPAVQAHVVRDELRGLGPLPATGRGLRAAAEAGATHAFVCAVDMPLLSVELIDDLTRRALETGADVVLPWDGQDHYLSAVYRTDLADRIDTLVAAGERRMRALFEVSDSQRVVLSNSAPLTNVNTAEDLRALAHPGA